jgi:hypothetical protein
MKAYLNLIPHPTYLESNKQTLEVCTDLTSLTPQKQEYIKAFNIHDLLSFLQDKYKEKFPLANYVAVANYIKG